MNAIFFFCQLKILYTCNYFLLLIYIGSALNLCPMIEVALYEEMYRNVVTAFIDALINYLCNIFVVTDTKLREK